MVEIKKDEQTTAELIEDLDEFISYVKSSNSAVFQSEIGSILIDRLNYCNTDIFYPELENTRTVTFAAHYVHKNCEMVLIRGDSGAGKTTALKLYVEQNAGVIFVTANASTKSATAILSKIAAAAGRHPNGNKKVFNGNTCEILKRHKMFCYY